MLNYVSYVYHYDTNGSHFAVFSQIDTVLSRSHLVRPSLQFIRRFVSFHRLTLSLRSRGARWRIKSQKSNSSKRRSNVAVRLLALPPSHNLPSTVSLAGLLSCRFHNILRSRRFLRYSSLLVVSPPLPGH